jgi:hypothetical protein
MLKDVDLEVRPQQLAQIGETHCHHGMFVVPSLTMPGSLFFNPQPQQLLITSAWVVPARAELE